uniref:B cell specific activator protein variant A delta 2/8/9 n=1 Tax=Homo sapiens TaxID=9606 RepID=C0KTF5_HUMAN|nr:B cell specific activator protein variant A delta 2/8/9 [Homo sapiens]
MDLEKNYPTPRTSRTGIMRQEASSLG